MDGRGYCKEENNMDNLMDLLTALKTAAKNFIDNRLKKEKYNEFVRATDDLAGAVKDRIKEGGTVTFKGADFHRDYEIRSPGDVIALSVDWLYFTDSEGKRIGLRMSRADTVTCGME